MLLLTQGARPPGYDRGNLCVLLGSVLTLLWSPDSWLLRGIQGPEVIGSWEAATAPQTQNSKLPKFSPNTCLG